MPPTAGSAAPEPDAGSTDRVIARVSEQVARVGRVYSPVGIGSVVR